MNRAANQLTIDYPSTLPDALAETNEQFQHEARMAMAVKLFELGRLSSGLAAELAGVHRVEFLLQLHRYRVPMIDLDSDELASDIRNA
jgi:predicted HTH domain antitoxin